MHPHRLTYFLFDRPIVTIVISEGHIKYAKHVIVNFFKVECPYFGKVLDDRSGEPGEMIDNCHRCGKDFRIEKNVIVTFDKEIQKDKTELQLKSNPEVPVKQNEHITQINADLQKLIENEFF